MSVISGTFSDAVEARARESLGLSNVAIYQMVAQALKARDHGNLLIDVGCGAGQLWPLLQEDFTRYIGVDILRYPGFPSQGEFVKANLENSKIPLPDKSSDVVVAVETIEHLENPRAFMRELTRLAKPGGWIMVTTPNQLSALSLLTLIFKKRFSAFQDVHYPTHISALLESDLVRMAAESGLGQVSLTYSMSGRIVLTPKHYPRRLVQLFPRACSDNLMLLGRKDY